MSVGPISELSEKLQELKERFVQTGHTLTTDQLETVRKEIDNLEKALNESKKSLLLG
jgi:hypothetical protein